MPQQPLVLNLPPGIRRDGAYIEGDLTCTEGRWVRFDRGRPRKMAGYQNLIGLTKGPANAIWVSDKDLGPGIYTGRTDGIDYVRLQGTTPYPPVDRSPAGFTDDARHLWQFDQLYSSTSSASVIIANPGLNLQDIANSTNSPIYYAVDNDTTDFAALNPTDGTTTLTGVSGGVAVLHPYAFYYGNDGYITWSAPNEPANLASADGGGKAAGARIAESKIVRGLPYRGGPGNSPAGLFWSLNSLVRLSFIGGSAVFQADIVSNDTTIMSSSTPIEYDGQFFWLGTDRFYVFNGVVRELANQMNLDFFFDNVNRTYAQKIFSFKVPRRGEVWWCFPFGNSTYCNWAVIYNVRNGKWYDTELPGDGRSSGAAAQVLGYPYLTGAAPAPISGGYNVWQHETGLNEVDGNTTNAIFSYYRTGNLALLNNGVNKNIYVEKVEPDFVQAGDMSMRVAGKNNARGDDILSDPFPFSPTTQLIHPKHTRRFLQLQFESNTLDGNYLMGTPVLHLQDSDARTSTRRD